MQDALPSSVPRHAVTGWIASTKSLIGAPSVTHWLAAAATSVLLIVSFPRFNLWPLILIALAPLLIVIGRRPAPGQAFLLGWFAGAIFFYGSCHWLTYSMIHYGGIPSGLAYLLLIPGALVLGFFPATFFFAVAHFIKTWGIKALFIAPLLWPALEWFRLAVTGQLWNAIGYSLAFQESLIQSARWGGVYMVGAIIITVNAAVAFVLLDRTRSSMLPAAGALMVATALSLSPLLFPELEPGPAVDGPITQVVALQPNVPMDLVKTEEEMAELLQRHITLSETGLSKIHDKGPRLVIWPESPMNFAYATDPKFRDFLARFTIANNTSVLFNSLEPAGRDGVFNSALLVNEQGRLVAQYDKIRLLPFGEYVPLPRWLPGANLVSAIVGDFTPGVNYTVMPVGNTKLGVFICVESAYPSIARKLSSNGADVLINVSNDGYLGPTAVMEQHLANAVFRAVENKRSVLRVTNTGITALITASGKVSDATQGFRPAVRNWTIKPSNRAATVYTRYGDLFPAFCTALALLGLAASFREIRG